MKKEGIEDFKYFVGIRSLGDLASKDDRVCVLNILGSESRGVTPVSHSYSGGNVAFGTSPGRQGQVLETPIGDIPVYNNVREGLKDGHAFNVGVVYLPPAGVRDGVAELIRVNPDLEKIIILTEKVSVHDAREIRVIGQQGRVDIFGANCLGIADSWLQVRYGGALGGDHPAETLHKGSVAIYSNSGNFTTTIANYLKTAGWGTTTSISSGKDVYIHFGAAEFAHALANDSRSKASVMYVEPGGYYEQELNLTKPTVACVVGRWKDKLSRAVGHAGAIGGTGDNAAAKEQWFIDHFGVDGLYTPENPVFNAQGAVVTNISHIPTALTEIMKLNGIEPDFEPEGDLTLKPWVGNNQGLNLPKELDIPVVEAIEPYRTQIASLDKQVGNIFPRQPMKDCSGSSVMDSTSQITRVNGISILDTSKMGLESNLCLNLVREPNGDNDNILFNVAVTSYINLHGDAILAAADAAYQAGNTPNTVLAAACTILGPARVEGAAKAADTLIDLFAHSGIENADDEDADISAIEVSPEQLACLTGKEPDAKAEAMLEALEARRGKSLFVHYIRSLDGHPRADSVLAALTTTIAWEPLMRKRISVITVRNMPWYATLFAVQIGASVRGDQHGRDSFQDVSMKEIMESWSVTEVAYLALTGKKPSAEELFPFQVMLGLIISNGVGTISAQGAKGAVSADGSETPERVQVNKAMTGFLTHTGYAHGGNGFEGIHFLIERFNSKKLDDAGNPKHGIDLKAMAEEYAVRFGEEKKARKALGQTVHHIPGVNHPVFKGLMINKDPREVFIADLLKEMGDSNVFHEFYSALVQALFDTGVTKNVFCVNIDAVIATILLKLLWPRYRSGDFSEISLETAAFTAFLFGRMAGCAGEIDDHINRGRDMDTRTPTSRCGYVS